MHQARHAAQTFLLAQTVFGKIETVAPACHGSRSRPSLPREISGRPAGTAQILLVLEEPHGRAFSRPAAASCWQPVRIPGQRRFTRPLTNIKSCTGLMGKSSMARG